MTSAAMANPTFLSPDAAAHNGQFGTHTLGTDANTPFDASTLAAMFPHDPSDPFLDPLRHASFESRDGAGFPSGASSQSSPGFAGRSLTLDARHAPGQSPRSHSASELMGPPGQPNDSQHDRSVGDHAAGFFNSPLAASPVEDRQSPFAVQPPNAQLQQTPTPSSSSAPGAAHHAKSFGPAINRAMSQTGMPNRSESLQSLSGFPPLTADDSPPDAAVKSEGNPRGNLAQHGLDMGEPSPADRSQVESDAAAEKRQSSRFVYKLMRMVTDPESQHLISFNPSGTSVVVTNFDDFAREVLPKHFKHSNFSSFIRQLNMYGFYKVNKTPRGQRNSADSQIWEFSHPKFIRGRYDLLDEIRRKALDTDQSRVEARADLQFNMSLGQFHIRQLLEEMQWRLDHTMEENRQLRDFSLQMHSALVSILEYIKVSNGGQMPFDVRLPMLDMMPSPMIHSPYVPGGAWGTPGPHQHPFHRQSVPQQPQQHHHHQPMYQQDLSAGPSHIEQQQNRPSILVTEPGFGAAMADPRLHPNGMPPPSPHDNNGAFSMSSLQGVSPLSSRRPSTNQDRLDMNDYFAAGPRPGGDGTSPNDMSGQDRGAIANMPRRSLSGRGHLAIDTELSLQEGQGGPLSASGNLTPASVFSMPASANGGNPGLGVMGQGHPQQQPVSPTNLGSQQHNGLLTAAVNTPLPPSPAIPGYGGDESPFAFNGLSSGRFPPVSQGNSNGSMSPAAFMNQATFAAHQHLANNENAAGSYHTTPIIGGGDSTFTLPMGGDDGFSGDRPNAKAMRTPLKRTASNSAEAAAQAAAEAMDPSMQSFGNPSSVTKRKVPV